MRGRKYQPAANEAAAAALAAAKRLVREGVILARSAGLPWARIEEELRLSQYNGNNAWRLAGNKNKPAKRGKKRVA